MGRWQKRILILVYGVLFLMIAGLAHGMSVTVAWDDVLQATGYKLHYKTGSSGPPYSTTIDVGDVHEYTIPNLPNENHYIVATAYDEYGRESGYSNEVIADPSGPDAPAIRIQIIVSTH